LQKREKRKTLERGRDAYEWRIRANSMQKIVHGREEEEETEKE